MLRHSPTLALSDFPSRFCFGEIFVAEKGLFAVEWEVGSGEAGAKRRESLAAKRRKRGKRNLKQSNADDLDAQAADGVSVGMVPSRGPRAWRAAGTCLTWGEDGLLIRPLKPPHPEEVAASLAETPIGNQSPEAIRAAVRAGGAGGGESSPGTQT